ncbi:hypothetical protein ABIA60_004513 [Pseudomonas frederiksbergensis]
MADPRRTWERPSRLSRFQPKSRVQPIAANNRQALAGCTHSSSRPS